MISTLEAAMEYQLKQLKLMMKTLGKVSGDDNHGDEEDNELVMQ